MATVKGGTLNLVKGYNRVLDNVEFAIKDIKRPKGFENASGFYTTEEMNIAIDYAKKAVDLLGSGVATINYYTLDLTKCEEDIAEAYYDSLNPESIRYVGDNIENLFPEECLWAKYNPHLIGKIFPVDVCHKCEYTTCKRSADFIKSILADAGDAYNITNILSDLVLDKISEGEALQKINDLLLEAGIEVKLQITLRPKVLKYLKFITAKSVEEVIRDGY